MKCNQFILGLLAAGAAAGYADNMPADIPMDDVPAGEFRWPIMNGG